MDWTQDGQGQYNEEEESDHGADRESSDVHTVVVRKSMEDSR